MFRNSKVSDFEMAVNQNEQNKNQIKYTVSESMFVYETNSSFVFKLESFLALDFYYKSKL